MIVKEMCWTPLACAAGLAPLTLTAMAFATMETPVWVKRMPVGCATVLDRFTSADAPNPCQTNATVRAMSKMSLGSAAAVALPTKMPTEFVTTLTIAWELWMIAAYATGLVPSWDVAATMFQKDFATQGNVLDAVGTCGGACQNDVNGDGICDDDSISGCTYAVACNYDPSASINDGSCDFTSCYGCSDITACNYDPA